MTRALAACAAAVAALAAVPAAQADCCDTAAPVAGAFSLVRDRAFLPVDRVEARTGLPALRHGAIAGLQNTGARLGPTAIPSGPEQDVTLPGLAGSGAEADPLTAAWVQGPPAAAPAGTPGQVRVAVLDAGGGTAASVVVGTSTTLEPPRMAGGPDGSRLVAWRDANRLLARRIVAGGVVGPEIVLTAGLSSARRLWLAADASGAATIVWHEPAGVRALRVPAGTDPAPSGAVALGTMSVFSILAVETDGAGGVQLVHATGSATAARRATRLVQLPAAAAAPRSTVIAGAAKGLKPSGALSQGAVAYLASGRSGRPDVFVRILSPGAPPRAGVNVSRTSTAEARVWAVALGVGERRVALYERRPRGHRYTDLLLRSIAVASKTPGVERNLSGTPRRDESDGRLLVAPDGRVYAAWTETRLVDQDVGSYTCQALRARVMTPNAILRPVVKLAECSVTSSA